MKCIKIISVVSISIFLSACSEEPMQIPEPLDIDTNKTVLVEDLTGVKCGPCGPAAQTLNEIIKNSGGNVIAYGIHGALQSIPHAESEYDFRYPDATELENSITSVNFFGKPGAMFNRILDDNGELVVSGLFSSWQSFIDEELQKTQVANIELSTAYNVDTRLVDVFVRVEAMEAISGNLSLNIVIAESKLIDPQSTTMGIIPDFEHNHVMKESLTELSGDFLSSGLSQGEFTEPKQYSYTLPEAAGEWIPENIEIIAFVSSESLGGEVLQAAMTVLPE